MVSGGTKAPARASVNPIVAAIGNFDGVHRGHQRLLVETVRFASAESALAGAVVFDPHPRRYFRPNDPPFLLTTPRRRDALLRAAGATQIISLPFDQDLAALTPEAFVAEILHKKLALAGVVTGTEFRFGKARAGDAEGLTRLCAATGVATRLVAPAPEAAGGEKIGSSVIRAMIESGDMRAGASMLGRPWSVDGEVASGQRLGRTLGFATANMTLGELVEPRRGVYAVEATIEGRRLAGVANFGRRPTIGATAPLLETHLFDFEGDLYGKTLDVAFIDFLRDERKFDGLDALKAQIAEDCKAARRILAALR